MDHITTRHATPPRTPSVLWLLGPCASGKTTIAREVVAELRRRRRPTLWLDGDDLRRRLSPDLGHDRLDRYRNHARAVAVAALAAAQGQTVVISMIGPTEETRAQARLMLGDGLRLIYLRSSEEARRARDPKGLYAADAHMLFEPPEPADDLTIIDTDQTGVGDATRRVLELLA